MVDRLETLYDQSQVAYAAAHAAHVALYKGVKQGARVSAARLAELQAAEVGFDFGALPVVERRALAEVRVARSSQTTTRPNKTEVKSPK